MNRYNKLLYLLVLLRLLLPYLLQNPVYEPHRDEFLYLAEGNHLAFGFMEVPPMLSIFAWLTHLLGDGIFWIKLWPSLFGAATFLVAGKITLLLGGRSFALFLLFLSFTFSVYLRMFFLFQPNAPEVFFWTMIIFSIIRHVQTGNNKWLYIFGISVGLGMLSKYSVSFYTVSVLAGLLLTKQRTIFLNKHFWLAALIGFLLFLPNLLWQYAHGFPVVFHMRELRETQLQYISPKNFLISQIMMFLPCSFVWLAGFVFTAFSKTAKPFRVVALAYIFVITILLVGHGKDYYAAGAYPVLLAFGAFALERATEFRFVALRYVMVIHVFIFGLLFLPLALPIFPPAKLAKLYKTIHAEKTGALKWEDLKNHPLPQDFSDMQGWAEMTQKVASAYHTLTNDEQKHTLIFCNNYGMAGAINYYGKKYNLPETYSDNASFLYWLPNNKPFNNLLLVCSDSNELKQDYIKLFKTATFTDSVTNVFAREHGDYIMLAKGGSDALNQFFLRKIMADKAKMQ